jgi:hypothetical protein
MTGRDLLVAVLAHLAGFTASTTAILSPTSATSPSP